MQAGEWTGKGAEGPGRGKDVGRRVGREGEGGARRSLPSSAGHGLRRCSWAERAALGPVFGFYYHCFTDFSFSFSSVGPHCDNALDRRPHGKLAYCLAVRLYHFVFVKHACFL